MNFNVHRRRKAISPVLATVILIAITLIAAIAVAGFVFGLFGTFTKGANVSSQVVSCVHNGGPGGLVGECDIGLTNVGGSSASVSGCSIYGAAGTLSLTATGAAIANFAVPPGQTTAIYVYCQAPALGTAGAVVSGQLTVASSAPLSFTATYS